MALASSPGLFCAPHGMRTKKACQLAKEVLRLLEDGQPRAVGSLRSCDGIGARFNKLFFQKQAVGNRAWRQWLASLPDVELVLPAAMAGKPNSYADRVRLRPRPGEGDGTEGSARRRVPTPAARLGRMGRRS